MKIIIKNITLIRIFSIAFMVILLLPQVAFAITLNLHYPVPPGAPDINSSSGQTLAGIAVWIFDFIVWISGFAAFVMLVIGGVEWLTSAGDPSKVRDAKDRIKSAVLGLVLVLAAFLILQIINPSFTTVIQPQIK